MAFSFIKTILQSSKPYSTKTKTTNKLVMVKGFCHRWKYWNFLFKYIEEINTEIAYKYETIASWVKCNEKLMPNYVQMKIRDKRIRFKVLSILNCFDADILVFVYSVVFFSLLSVSKRKLFKWIEIHEMLSNSSENIIKSETSDTNCIHANGEK